jgi:hypothetical protein
LNEKDYLYGMATLSIWSQTETTLAIIAGSLPALRPLLRQLPSFFGSTKDMSARRSSYKLPDLTISKKNKRSEGVDLVTYMGHTVEVLTANDRVGDMQDSASQTHILGKDHHDIILETRIEIKSERVMEDTAVSSGWP